MTQRAKLLGRVQGVVVHATKAAFSGSPTIGKDTIISGSGTSYITPIILKKSGIRWYQYLTYNNKTQYFFFLSKSLGTRDQKRNNRYIYYSSCCQAVTSKRHLVQKYIILDHSNLKKEDNNKNNSNKDNLASHVHDVIHKIIHKKVKLQTL